MLPIKGNHPEINILYIGAQILKKLNDRKNKRIKTTLLFKTLSKELSVSIDHIILALDWLYIISAINYNDTEVFINEAK
ncbi:ABC-three component system middle component 6 [uncultured Psychromonas sp.]|uniref:ABC-three component system middle component 6 n=1 Tax=uncultured Psychromonas sp. TaxID=173974 RepID=UPI0034502243